jgi:solute carrier family 25 phosphate transporter 23/24/25/41
MASVCFALSRYRIAPYLGLDFAVYEGLKKCVPVDGEDGKPAKSALFACGAMAGTVGQCVSYPIDTVRRRMQVQGFGPAAAAYHYGHSISATMATIVKEEGIRGLYKGMTANLAKVAPAVSISFVTYEYMRELLGLEGL